MEADSMNPPEWTQEYREKVRRAAQALNSDGCTMVPEFFQDSCFDHDIHYRTHQWLDGTDIMKDEADRTFRQHIQATSLFGRWSPLAYWRYCAVQWFGGRSWEHTQEELDTARSLVKAALG